MMLDENHLLLVGGNVMVIAGHKRHFRRIDLHPVDIFDGGTEQNIMIGADGSGAEQLVHVLFAEREHPHRRHRFAQKVKLTAVINRHVNVIAQLAEIFGITGNNFIMTGICFYDQHAVFADSGTQLLKGLAVSVAAKLQLQTADAHNFMSFQGRNFNRKKLLPNAGFFHNRFASVSLSKNFQFFNYTDLI